MTVLQYSSQLQHTYQWWVHVNTVMEIRARKCKEVYDKLYNYQILKTNCDTNIW
jgi:hypothetical protein